MATILDPHKPFEKIKKGDLARPTGKYKQRFYVRYGKKYPLLQLITTTSEDYVGSSKRMLHFNLYAAGGASKFVRHEGGTWLAHDGRVAHRPEAGSPGMGFASVVINDRIYHLIAPIESDQFFQRIVDYHFSRYEAAKISGRKSPKSGKFGGQNGGATGPFRTESSDKHPLHKTVVDSLRAAIPPEWTNIDGNKIAPDLFVRYGDHRVLFEIKPSSDFSNMCHAVGQLMYYSKFIECTKRVYVAFGIPDDEGEHLENLSSFGIIYLNAKAKKQKSGSDIYTFPKLAHVLA
jgi:hypothetical protein